MNPTLEQLARYVVQELERGVPEVTLYSALRESGWTQEWISAAFSTAKQRAMPDRPGQMNFPTVQAAAAQAPVQTPTLPPIQRQPLVSPVHPREIPKKRALPPKQPRSLDGLKKTLLIVIVVLSAVVLGLSVWRTIHGLQRQAVQRVTRDADRREDLSVLLSNLSDYYLTHHSYPTRTQLNSGNFLRENGFSEDSITDPKWTKGDENCTKNAKPILAGVIGANCYTYEVKTDKDGICNNASTPCTKVKVSIWLEVDKQAYSVTFDKNTQAN